MATNADISPAEIRYRLNLKGLTYADVDRAYGLVDGTARRAARQPHFGGEMALAEMLSCSPRDLWPSRFGSVGDNRLKPQPPQNYTNPPRMMHRQKGAAA